MCSKYDKLYLVLNLFHRLNEIFRRVHEEIFKEYEISLNNLISKTNEFNRILEHNFSFKHISLFKEWENSQHNFSKNEIKLDVLKLYFSKLIKTIQLDLNYIYDEKFVLWCFQNNFSKYFK